MCLPVLHASMSAVFLACANLNRFSPCLLPQVETEELVEVNVTTDDDLGTIYSVAVPVKRVKPTARFGLEESLEVGLLLWLQPPRHWAASFGG